MKLKSIISLFFLLLAVNKIYCQQPFCADSSIRVKYIFGSQGASLVNFPDTTGKNIFMGYFSEGINSGLAVLKTDWGDSMLFARKIFVDGKANNTILMADSSIIFSGYYGAANNSELLISRLHKNGTVQWIKRYRLTQNHLRYPASTAKKNNVIVTNDAIYFNGTFFTTAFIGYNVIAKLNLNGNVLWSKSFRVTGLGGAGLVNAPVLDNNTVIFAADYREQVGSTLKNFRTVLTRLNNTDGSLIETVAIRITDTDTLGFSDRQFSFNPVYSSFSLMGDLTIIYPIGIGGSNMVFNTLLDKNFNPVHSYFYKNNILSASSIYYAHSKKQTGFLASAASNFKEKYLTIFDKTSLVFRTRKFTITSFLSQVNQASLDLDDKQNLHFLFHYPQSSQLVTEYARISNFAPNGTTTCFGKDTSILTRFPLTLAKEPFIWDYVDSDLITAFDIPYWEDTAIVTKELVCKMVSYCDSVHISGPKTVCINQPVRYTVTKNTSCLKSLQWNIDESIATIINTEADTAITIRFNQAFTGYLHAAVFNCVVKDSFFVTVKAPQAVKIINRDSLLCPGKSMALKAKTGFASYQWQDGSTADTLRITTPGFYKVTGTDSCAVQTADSITISKADTSFLIPASQTICLHDTAIIVLPTDVNNIAWQPLINGILNNKTLSLFPLQTTTYQITAERLANCTLTAISKVVIENCSQEIFIPNAFTPNNDSRNDIFKASTFRPLQSYQLIIYNRYSQIVFETKTFATGWDGTFKGKPQPMGGYIYHCLYQFVGRPVQQEQGTFTLIR